MLKHFNNEYIKKANCCIKWLVTTLCLVAFLCNQAFAVSDTLSSLSISNSQNKLISAVDLLTQFRWNVIITDENNKERQIVKPDLDTLNFDMPKHVRFSTTIFVSPQLKNKSAAIAYSYEGSVRLTLNGEILIATGVYNSKKDPECAALKKADYLNLVLKDSALAFEIDYIPDPEMKVVSFGKLSIMTPEVAEAKKESFYESNNSSYALGFYYLAFGVVFLILFLFFREKTENFYFALFCISASLSWLLNTSKVSGAGSSSMLAFIYALEFLSLFLAKVLANKNKSLLHLVVITLIAAIIWIPAIRFYYIFLFGNPVPLIRFALIVILICYSGFSSIYFLFQGFGQKRWEARTILYLCLTGVALGVVAPLIITTMSARTLNQHGFDLAAYFAYVGLGIYPFSAAIVLGKRNGLNQKQLLQQISSIEKLSSENLQKEKEKKELLETQNVALEQKVVERTAEVMQQKEVIEIKNNSITDNLIYAQRIQSAILPDIKLITKAFEQSFIIYLPKDIVSGDFYAFAEKDNWQIIVAGDCTGHGVSGAFMSMIGSSLLNQIITEMQIIDPGQILTQLNKAVIETLKQGENDTNDGMDICLCAFNAETRTVQYAGANRPLWLIRKEEFILLKPDKYPIGGLQMAKDRAFKNNILQLERSDTLYLFTDGFADQFGGEHGKKLMSGKFREMLLSIQELDMKAQGNYLNASFNKWKGNHEQVDDVLVIGLRII